MFIIIIIMIGQIVVAGMYFGIDDQMASSVEWLVLWKCLNFATITSDCVEIIAKSFVHTFSERAVRQELLLFVHEIMDAGVQCA